MTILTAPIYGELKGQLVFLAGPIQGAGDWQKNAINLLSRDNPHLDIASPRGDYSKLKFDYDTQVGWESHYLNEAANTGAILFWLAKEKEHMCDRCFAQTTRFEIAEWVNKYRQNKKIRLVIGIEPGFSGERYIRKRINQDCPELNIHSSLEDVCKEVVEKLK